MAKSKGEKTFTMSETQIKSLIQTSVNTAITAYRQEQEKAVERQADRRRYNTRLLLENYNRLNQYADAAIYSVDQLMESDSIGEEEIQVMMKCGFKGEDIILRSIAEGALTVKGLMIQVNKMLDIYRQDCETSSSITKQRQYRVIRDMYLAENRLSTREIAENEQQELRTIQNDAKQAREDISVLLFGINGLVNQILT